MSEASVAGHGHDGLPERTQAKAGEKGLLRGCDDCGLFVRMPPISAGLDSRCPRCDAVLRRHRASPVITPLALCATSLIFCIVTLTTPFLTIHLLGRMRSSQVESGAWAFVTDGLWLLAVLLVATVVLVPLLRLSLRLTVLGGLLMERPPRLLVPALRLHERLGAWSMLEVFLFGALVSYTRLADLAEVQFGPAVYGLGAVVVAMVAADAAFEPQAAWDVLEDKGVMARPGRREAAVPGGVGAGPRGVDASGQRAGTMVGRSTLDGSRGAQAGGARPALAREAASAHGAGAMLIGCHCCRRVAPARPGEPCARCGAPLHPRKPNSLVRCWSLVIAAAILYVPANLYPVMTIVTLGQGGPHTIMGGVVEFIETGFWPLALIVFTASVAVPMLKLVGLTIMLIDIGCHAGGGLRQRTKLYRVIEVLGRWSMIDVFVVAVLVALVRFGVLASITAGVGAACFGGVVILTMLAAEAFDPRLMWDAVEADARPRPKTDKPAQPTLTATPEPGLTR